MPGRIASSGHASPGPQVLVQQDRPVPAVRRSTQQFPRTDASLPAPGQTERVDLYRDTGSLRYSSTVPNNNGFMHQHSADDKHNGDVSILTSYRSPAQPQKPVSTVRPQSAMAMTSPSHNKHGYTDRPPSSMGVTWTPPNQRAEGGARRVTTDDRSTPINTQASYEARLQTPVTTGQSEAYNRPNTLNGLTSVYDSRVGARFDNRQPMRLQPQSATSQHQSTTSQHQSATLHQQTASHKLFTTSQHQSPSTHQSATSYPFSTSHHQPTTSQHQPTTSHHQSTTSQHQPTTSHHQSTTSYNNENGHLISRGMDNLAFMPDNEGQKQKGPTTTSHYLRNAWQKLYMQEPSSHSARDDRQSLNHSAREDRQSLNHSAREDRQSLNHSLVEERSNNRRTPTVEDNPTFQNGMVSNNQHLTYHPNHPISNAVTSQHNVRPANSVASAANSVRRPSIGSLTANKAPASTHNTLSKSEFPYGSTHSLNQHHNVQGRESPTGQISTHPDQLAINTSSHLSSYPSANRNLSTFKPEKDKPAVTSEPAIGPAAKYPESTMSRRSSGSITPLPLNNQNHRHNIPSPQFPSSLRQHRSESTNSFDTIEFNLGDKPPRPMSRLHTKGANFLDSEDDLGDEYTLQPLDSIFDYPDAISQDGSETPPLQPLSPNLTPRGSNSSTPRFNYLPKQTDVQKSPPKTPDLLRSGSHNPLKTGATLRNHENKEHLSQFKYQQPEEKDFLQKSGLPIKAKGKQLLSEYTRSRSLEDVRESGNESTISFDIENTVLTVEPSDQSELGTLRSYKGSSVRAQLSRLEGMYSHVMKTLEENAHSGVRTRRRWSIGSSDTSSLRQPTRQSRHSRASNHRIGSKDVRAIGKRFQRLESHVITLARSVAHLSSELRTQGLMTREIENVKREISELRLEKQTQPTPHSSGTSKYLTEGEKYRYWSPFFANPRRVGKLTQFFGQEPPLLELFLKKLGYEKYLKNFESEHIGMIELPYMTEDRLQSIGIPMGPRLRIMQEAQVCVQQGNFDIYFV